MYKEIGLHEVFRILACYMARHGGGLYLCLRHETRGVMLAGTAKIALFLDAPEMPADGSIALDGANGERHLFGGEDDWRAGPEPEKWRDELCGAFRREDIRVTEVRSYAPLELGINNVRRGWDYRIEKESRA